VCFQVVKFDAAIIEDARVALGRQLGAPKQNAIDGRDPRVQPLAALHRRLLEDAANAPALEQDLCAAVSAFIELISFDHVEHMPPTAASVAVARARAMLDARLTETVTLDELAAHARLDSSGCVARSEMKWACRCTRT
jgi:hypothetical protein